MFKSIPEIEFVPKSNNIVLINELKYHDLRSNKLFIVPAGFTCDGASIPKFAWSIVGHPFSKKVRAGAVLHDWLYRNGVVPRGEADQIFYDALREYNMGYFKAQAFYMAVRTFGGSSYKG